MCYTSPGRADWRKVGLMHEPETSRDIRLLFTKNLMAPSILLK